MSESLYIAATGMNAQQQNIDVIANNLANVNTTGFKKSRVEFEDLMYREMSQSGSLIEAGNNSVPVGVGSGIGNASKIFSMGDIKKTERSLDLAIQGAGFFEVMLPDGSNGYTRTGAFGIDNNGMLVNSDGYSLSPHVQLPPDAQELIVKSDGEVSVRVAGEEDLVRIGNIELAKFINPAGLNPVGGNLYMPTHHSGDAMYATPGEEGAGIISQGFLESSNVKLVEELTSLVLAQRAYEINSKVLQASDEMLGIINNLRR